LNDYRFAHEQGLAEIRAARRGDGTARASLTERAKAMTAEEFDRVVTGADRRVWRVLSDRVLSDRVMHPEEANALHFDIVAHLLEADGVIYAGGLTPMPEWWDAAEAQSRRNRR
jgi:hypothetical protein